MDRRIDNDLNYQQPSNTACQLNHQTFISHIANTSLLYCCMTGYIVGLYSVLDHSTCLIIR